MPSSLVSTQFYIQFAILVFTSSAVLLQTCQKDKQKYSGPCCPKEPKAAYFFHVPKSGGTSVRKLLEGFFVEQGFDICDLKTNIKLMKGKETYGCVIGEHEELYQTIYRDHYLNECNMISSHFDATLLNRLPVYDQNTDEKQILDVVSIRNPVHRTLSRLGHYLSDEVDDVKGYIHDKNNMKQLLELIKGFSNSYVRQLSGYNGCFLEDGFFKFFEGKSKQQVMEEHLEIAKQNLKSFCVQIILEHPRCGLEKLASVFNIPKKQAPQLNQFNLGSVSSWPEIFYKAAVKYNELDWKFYEFALKLNRQNCQYLSSQQ